MSTSIIFDYDGIRENLNRIEEERKPKEYVRINFEPAEHIHVQHLQGTSGYLYSRKSPPPLGQAKVATGDTWWDDQGNMITEGGYKIVMSDGTTWIWDKNNHFWNVYKR